MVQSFKEPPCKIAAFFCCGHITLSDPSRLLVIGSCNTGINAVVSPNRNVKERRHMTQKEHFP